jgi:hypothetical protein
VIPGSPPDLRHPPPGCRFAPRCPFVMPVCTEVVPPEVTFDGVRVACHLYPPGSDGTPAGMLAPDYEAPAAVAPPGWGAASTPGPAAAAAGSAPADGSPS